MQPVWLCIHSSRQFEETFEKTRWGKINQAGAFHRIYDILLSILIYLSFLLWLTDRLFRPQYSSLVAKVAREELKILSQQSNNHVDHMEKIWFGPVQNPIIIWVADEDDDGESDKLSNNKLRFCLLGFIPHTIIIVSVFVAGCYWWALL